MEAWKNAPRQFPPGTIITKTDGEHTIEGTVSAHANELNDGVPTGNSLNWIVYKEDPAAAGETLTDVEVEKLDSRIPKSDKNNGDDEEEEGHFNYPIGTMVRVLFTDKYFDGRVLGHRHTHRATINWVVYTDGDCEEMDDQEIRKWHQREADMQKQQQEKKNGKRKRDKKVKQEHDSNNGGKADVASPQLPTSSSSLSSIDPKQEPEPSCVLSSSPSNQRKKQKGTGTRVAIKSEDDSQRPEPACVSSSEPPSCISSAVVVSADSAASVIELPSSHANGGASSVRKIQETMETGQVVKLEPDKQHSSDIIKRFNDITTKWVKANTDPATGKGRYVFRQACDPFCILKLLGGDGMDWMNWSKVADFPFNPKSHIWVAGTEAWNPYGPQYPGAEGLVDARVLNRVERGGGPSTRERQTEFHMFIQCSTDRLSKHWHGKLAAGGRHYVGVYKIPEDAITTKVLFKNVPPASQKHVAESKLKRLDNDRKPRPFDNKEENDEDVVQAKKIHAEEWNSMTQKQQDVASYTCSLIRLDYSWLLTNVEFVRYHEDLYKALQDIEVNGKRGSAVCARKGKLGRVSIDPSELGRYQ
mmetsp:Transcript_13308/g.36720  ORF Transcript_13308/g.36720 Transcript_13308/m.36720 type:complete len:586 (+) Transcript_13308:138-1895(+)|eukprot:CAMPEP_0168736402 /NCGR_PEP_ID=MMETSP0724-20121128/9842_1 /TAXON_ID=265536 /ORGANISM="Amphiprora sp., Strain CCMP467" /LENGTH=585 /DNA_ID=CAMNT_0008783599 /DNA_START=43 /DNA_END=1800 /DNA_ORIENTATION=-